MSSLPPLKIPKRLIGRRQEEEGRAGGREGVGEGEGTEGGGDENMNQTDQEKSVAKRTAALLEVGCHGNKLYTCRLISWY